MYDDGAVMLALYCPAGHDTANTESGESVIAVNVINGTIIKKRLISFPPFTFFRHTDEGRCAIVATIPLR